jgi:hypothetical protein
MVEGVKLAALTRGRIEILGARTPPPRKDRTFAHLHDRRTQRPYPTLARRQVRCAHGAWGRAPRSKQLSRRPRVSSVCFEAFGKTRIAQANR